MLGLFPKKDPIKKLQKEYEKLQKEAYTLSHTDRKASDAKTAKAQELLAQIDKLQQGKP